MKGLGTPATNHSSHAMSKAVVDAVMRATALLA